MVYSIFAGNELLPRVNEFKYLKFLFASGVGDLQLLWPCQFKSINWYTKVKLSIYWLLYMQWYSDQRNKEADRSGRNVLPLMSVCAQPR